MAGAAIPREDALEVMAAAEQAGLRPMWFAGSGDPRAF